MKVEKLKGMKVGVVGLGPRTGVSLVQFLCSKGALVTAYDEKHEDELREALNVLKRNRFTLCAGAKEPTGAEENDLLILSPGVPCDLAFLDRARRAGKPVISEIEFASRHISAPLLVITGTNGKSTTTSLLASVLEAWGKKIFAGGNLGDPLINAVDRKLDFVVAEVSSFQLECVDCFRPQVGVLLNISANHLDRHKDMDSYVRIKERVFARMTGEDVAILNADDERCVEISKKIKAKVQFFSSKAIDAHVRVEKARLLFKDDQEISLENFKLFGPHNRENAAAVALAARAVGCPLHKIEEGFRSFKGLPHRLQVLGTVDGVLYVNDSKSTSPDSTVKALDAFSNPIVLLLGGRPKGASYHDLAEVAARSVKKVILFGEAAASMRDAFESLKHIVCVDSKEAFAVASNEAQMGDVVLFSPANSSFDEFENFEERGNSFKEFVNGLKGPRQ